ncbi:hypothetical protein [Paenibacillus sp. MBLB4367]|uniref:hypothetical protein n=1 Tax=Paenibacillus sp. MBLB4367 TaxID=3384767 RepID=UPI003908169F
MIRESERTKPHAWESGRLNTAVLFLLVAVSFFGTIYLFQKHPEPRKPVDYRYAKVKALNGVQLHLIRTSPRNVELRAIDANVTDTGEYGINGGFFWEGSLLSIAVKNNVPLKGAAGDYGSGWYNIDNSKGTLVFDETAERFSVQVAADPDGLAVTDRGRYWAQGGISMRLGDDAGWYEQALIEGLPAIDEKRMRSGLVYDREGYLWMIVTPTKSTGEEFRTAVKETLVNAHPVDGIFLDGDGSSQMKVAEATLPGDRREVYQMLAIVQK